MTGGAERGLGRFEGFSDAVFAIALTACAWMGKWF